MKTADGKEIVVGMKCWMTYANRRCISADRVRVRHVDAKRNKVGINISKECGPGKLYASKSAAASRLMELVETMKE